MDTTAWPDFQGWGNWYWSASNYILVVVQEERCLLSTTCVPGTVRECSCEQTRLSSCSGEADTLVGEQDMKKPRDAFVRVSGLVGFVP